MCGNPAYAEPSFDPVKGRYSEAFTVPLATARSADGLCGPEALLFQRQAVLMEAAKGTVSGLRTVLAYATGGLIILGLAAQLLGSSG